MNNLMTANQLKEEQSAIIVKLNMEQTLPIRLTTMGIIVGSKIRIISKNGTILLAVGPMRFGISQEVAKQIIVYIEN